MVAQIYLNSDLVTPKTIHVYNSSAQLWESEKVGYVRVNGEWIPFIEYVKYIIRNGSPNNLTVPSKIAPYYNIIEQLDGYIKLEGTNRGEGTGSRTYINEYVDFTDYNTLTITYSYTVGTSQNRLLVSPTMERNSTTLGIITMPNSRDVTSISLNVSDIVGHNYIGIFTTPGGSFGLGTLNIYDIYLE